MTQPSLFSTAADRERRFLAFHKAHPEVYTPTSSAKQPTCTAGVSDITGCERPEYAGFYETRERAA